MLELAFNSQVRFWPHAGFWRGESYVRACAVCTILLKGGKSFTTAYLHSFHLWLPKCNRNIVCYELFTKQWCIYLNGFGSRNVLVLIPHVFVVISRSSRCGCHLGLVAVGFLPLRCLGLSLSLVFFPFSVFSLSFPFSCCGGLLQLRAFIAKKEPWPSYAAR